MTLDGQLVMAAGGLVLLALGCMMGLVAVRVGVAVADWGERHRDWPMLGFKSYGAFVGVTLLTAALELLLLAGAVTVVGWFL